jgi:hypothetical protein
MNRLAELRTGAMDNLASATVWQIIAGLFTIVILPLLFLILKRILIDRPPKTPTNGLVEIRLRGPWEGDGFVYELEMDLCGKPPDLTGTIKSKLEKRPATSDGPTGMSGEEKVSGYYEGNHLHLITRSIDDKDGAGLVPCSYSIYLTEKQTKFQGTTLQIKDGRAGRMHGKAVITRT